MSSVATSATVVSLVAEVRVLLVGSRQITLSVFRQLDEVDAHECDPMGRINEPGGLWMVGRHRQTGALVRARFDQAFPVWTRDDAQQLDRAQLAGRQQEVADCTEFRDHIKTYQERWHIARAAHLAQPLIVLAGLK